MDSVQRLRHQAESTGNLKSTPQQTITNDGPTVVIQPAEPNDGLRAGLRPVGGLRHLALSCLPADLLPTAARLCRRDRAGRRARLRCRGRDCRRVVGGRLPELALRQRQRQRQPVEQRQRQPHPDQFCDLAAARERRATARARQWTGRPTGRASRLAGERCRASQRPGSRAGRSIARPSGPAQMPARPNAPAAGPGAAQRPAQQPARANAPAARPAAPATRPQVRKPRRRIERGRRRRSAPANMVRAAARASNRANRSALRPAARRAAVVAALRREVPAARPAARPIERGCSDVQNDPSCRARRAPIARNCGRDLRRSPRCGLGPSRACHIRHRRRGGRRLDRRADRRRHGGIAPHSRARQRDA